MKLVGFLFSVLLCGFLFGQNVVVEMNDGTTKEGKMDRVTTEMKLYKLKPLEGRKGTEFLKKKDVKSIKYYYPQGISYFKKVKMYTNPKNKKVAKQEVMLELVYTGENIQLFHGYKNDSKMKNVYTEEFYFCLRPGEEVVSYISWTMVNQIGKNTIFRQFGAEYFKDYPALYQKIKDRKYKYDDIFEVVKEYDVWKSGNKIN